MIRVRFTTISAAFLMMVCIVSSCLSDEVVPASKIHIVTSIKPLSLITAQLLGDSVHIKQLLPDGQDPHHQHLKFSQVKHLQQADMTFWFGPQLESGLSNIMARQSNAVELGSLVLVDDKSSLLYGDLHIWLNPQNAVLIAAAITRQLVTFSPENNRLWQQKLQHFEAEMIRLDDSISEHLLPVKPLIFISDHNAYAHFSSYFGLAQVGALHNVDGTQISAREMAKLRQLQYLDCIVVEPAYNAGKAERLASTWQVSVLELDPLGSSTPLSAQGYSDLIKTLAEQFSQCKISN